MTVKTITADELRRLMRNDIEAVKLFLATDLDDIAEYVDWLDQSITILKTHPTGNPLQALICEWQERRRELRAPNLVAVQLGIRARSKPLFRGRARGSKWTTAHLVAASDTTITRDDHERL